MVGPVDKEGRVAIARSLTEPRNLETPKLQFEFRKCHFGPPMSFCLFAWFCVMWPVRFSFSMVFSHSDRIFILRAWLWT